MSDQDDKREVRLPEDTGTVSGLDETQIDAADLRKLQEAFRLRQALPLPDQGADQRWISAGLRAESIHIVEPAVSTPAIRRVRIEPLPSGSGIRRYKLPAGLFHVRRDLKLALSQPVRRRRLNLGELSAKQEKELYRKLYEKYGERAKSITVQAVFAHVPPEAARSARLSSDLRLLSFVFPPDVSPRSAEEGHYYIVLQDERNKTWSALFRL